MRILRANRNTLHTILGAIVADPLFKFSLSPAEARRRQQVGEEGIKEENLKDDEAEAAPEPDKRAKESERALAQILAKLEGREEGSAERHSVEGQVQMLINSARDRTNLSNIFLGWSPWV
jgi:ataxia telangiectasia mutated family protein